MSHTPRNINVRPRISLTPTQAGPSHHVECASLVNDWDQDDRVIGRDEHAWGDDAVLQWEGVESVNSEDDISSVAPEEAGVSDDDEENWGRDAIIDFTYSSQETRAEFEQVEREEEKEQDEEVETIEMGDASVDPWSAGLGVVEETTEQLQTRGMPDYQSWDDVKLQRLTEKYGYRPITKHSALVKIATECWKAIHPAPKAPASAIAAPASRADRIKRAPKPVVAEVEESDGSVTSSDIPLAQSTKKNSKGKGKAKAKATEMVSEEEEVEEIEVPLPERFEKMIRDDRDLYLRMLRYEPISFDELISKAIANKISGKGWKDQLKRFLDLQGITFYTADPTGQRRRR